MSLCSARLPLHFTFRILFENAVVSFGRVTNYTVQLFETTMSKHDSFVDVFVVAQIRHMNSFFLFVGICEREAQAST